MLYQYYFKRLKLFRLPYKILLAYHCPGGNSIKKWTNYQMLQNIIAIRKEIHILSMTFTVIQIRRALNILFQRINTRGTFIINSQPSNGLKINQNSVFVVVTDWLPGLLTNYRQLILSIRRNQRYSSILSFYLKRPQQYAVLNTSIKNRPLAEKIIQAPKRRVPALPSVSLSLSDNKIWLNETACLGIPSIQLCDTQSDYQKITYPIIANQQSITFNYLLISLFSETCNFSIMFEHLYFLSIFKYLNKKKSIRKKIKRKALHYNLLNKLRIINNDYLSFKRYVDSNDIGYNFWSKNYKNKRKFKMRRFNKVNIVHKKTYILNTRLFSYQIREAIKYSRKNKEIFMKSPLFFSILKNILYLVLKNFSKKLIIFEKIQKLKDYRKKKALRKKYNFKKKLYLYRKILKNIYIKIFGLSNVLHQKNKQKKRYINNIIIYKKNIPNRQFLGFMYTNKLFKKLSIILKKSSSLYLSNSKLIKNDLFYNRT